MESQADVGSSPWHGAVGVWTGAGTDLQSQRQEKFSSISAPHSSFKGPVVSESLDSGADLGRSWECDSGTASDDDGDEDANDTLKVEKLETALGKCQLEKTKDKPSPSKAPYLKFPKPNLSTTSPVYSSVSRQVRSVQLGTGDLQAQNTQAKKNLTNIWTSEDSCSSDISEPYSFDGDVDCSTSTETGEDSDLHRFASQFYNYAPKVFQKTSTIKTVATTKPSVVCHSSAIVDWSNARPSSRLGAVLAQSSSLPMRHGDCLTTSPRTFPRLTSQTHSTSLCSAISTKLLNVLRPSNPVPSRHIGPVNSLKRQLVAEEISSEDEEICALLASEAKNSPRAQKLGQKSKVATPTKTVRPSQSPARQSLRSTPRKRHRSSQDENETRPSLNFDKMQRTVLHRQDPAVPEARRTRCVQVVRVQTRGSRKGPTSEACDPSKFEFRSISQQCSSLPPVETPFLSLHQP